MKGTKFHRGWEMFKIDKKHWFIEYVLHVYWIINKNSELGLRIFGMNFWYYKDSRPILLFGKGEDEYSSWRKINKIEFGEVILSEDKRKELGE